MNNKLVTFVLLPGLFFLTSTMARADEADSSVSVELGRDNNNGTERYVDLTLGLTGGMQLLVSQGQSETNDASGDLQTDSWSIGLASDPAKDISVAVYYSNWVDKDALEIDTLALDLILNTNDWGFIVSPQTRDIRLDGVNLRDATFNSQGIGLTVEYYGVRDFYFSAAYLFNTYPSNLSALANNPIISRRSFSSAGLDQAFGLEDNRTTLGLGYSFSSAMLGAQRSMSVFAVDNSSSTIDTIYLSGNISSQWRAKLSVGKSSSDGVVDDAIFTNVALTYRW